MIPTRILVQLHSYFVPIYYFYVVHDPQGGTTLLRQERRDSACCCFYIHGEIYEISMFVAWFHKATVVFCPTEAPNPPNITIDFLYVFGIATEHAQTLVLHMSFVQKILDLPHHL